MATQYPVIIDTSITLPTANDNATGVNAVSVNQLRDAIIAIENELGTKPSGIYGTVKTRLDALEAAINSGGGGGGGGGNFTAGGDLTGTPSFQIVAGLQTRPLSNASPINSAVPVWDTNVYDIRRLTQDDILPGFSASLSGGSTVEVGATVSNPSFTASYSATPSAASISNTDGINSPLSLSFPYTSVTVVGNFTHTSIASVGFTLAAVGSTTKTSSVSINYLARSFGGVGTSGATGASASGSNATLSGATGTLSNLGLLSSDVGQVFGPFSPTGQKIYLLLLGGAHSFKDSLTGFAFVMNSPTSVSFVNQNGSTISMFLYESTNILSTPFNILVNT